MHCIGAPEGGQSKLRSPHQATKSPLDFFALVIGINEYQHVKPKLSGAVPDANQFESFLRTTLQKTLVGDIKSLRDGEATRSAIIQNMKALKYNQQIVKDKTAIIIYYAGHGGRAKKPESWKDWPGTQGQIELICPVDAQSKAATNCSAGERPVVESIPDRTINYILRDLSAAKGNNITLIFDCCHSAGMNRALNSNGMVVRGLVDILTISAECDTDIVSLERGHSNRETPSSNEVHEGSCASWDTHILLAACARGQEARERDSRGDFTRALLNVLVTVPIFNLTYRSLMDSLKMPPDSSQTPHLDGKHTNRRLFTFSESEEAVADSMIHCSPLKRPHDIGLSLQAGSIQGVVTGSIYDIYNTDLPKSVPLVTASVASVHLFTSELELKSDDFIRNSSPDSILYARLSKVSRFRLLAYCNDLDLDTLRRVSKEGQYGHVKLTYPLHLAHSREKADICLKVDGNRVLFSRGGTNSFFDEERCCFNAMKPDRFFQAIRNLLPPYFPYNPLPGNIDGIRVFLNQYAHFTYHTSMQSSMDLECLVSIEMHRLKRDEKDNFHVVDDRNMLSDLETQDYVKIAVTTAESLDDARSSNKAFRYGFTIQSKSEKKLYPHILCFDPSNLKIDVIYSNMTSTRNPSGELNVETCLLNNGSKVSFGLANSMVQPLLFSLSEGQNSDVQFIKILVTTEPVDLRCILQHPVKACILQPPVKAVGKARGLGLDRPASLEWASQIIPFVVIRERQSRDVETARNLSSRISTSLL
ncbi:caspase domain-containing protein [Armillaria nabsnona]|nr:caspase domain-containing protein [Armillaria nabsnona]